MNYLIAGGTGSIGSRLAFTLARNGHAVVLLSRSPRRRSDGIRMVTWDGKNAGPWCRELDAADVVFNLAGAGIADRRWSASQKSLIRASRINATNAIVRGIDGATDRPRVLVNASAVGYYGNVPEGVVTESARAGNGFLSDVCAEWEAAAVAGTSARTRVVLARTGIVLDPASGALRQFLLPFRFFFGGTLGSGRQWLPWIHIDDEVRALLFAADTPTVSGPVNLTAPAPVTMREFCRTLGDVLHRPDWLPVPSFALDILLGEMAGPLVLEGQRVVPERLLQAGFEFRFPSLEGALRELLSKRV